ncbi:MAG: gamma-glutamyl kinase, partial [Thalassovita sp.]|nr:gamma-glutamyl kinase [Thalassovita sp.]
FANVGSQYKFLEPRPNGTAIDHLFRYEDQPALISFLQDRLSTKLDLSRENVSPSMELNLSPAVESLLRERRAEEFRLWESIGG